MKHMYLICEIIIIITAQYTAVIIFDIYRLAYSELTPKVGDSKIITISINKLLWRDTTENWGI